MNEVDTYSKGEMIGSFPFHLTQEKIEKYKSNTDFEDLTEEQVNAYLKALWKLSCTITAVHFGLSSVQSIMGISDFSAKEDPDDSV